MKMKMYYLSQAQIPSKKAISIQQMRMCEAFARCGVEVCLIHPYYFLSEDMRQIQDIWEFYQVDKIFRVVTLPALMGNIRTPPRVGGLTIILSSVAYIFAQILHGRLSDEDVIYSRNFRTTYLISELIRLLPESIRPKIFYESHVTEHPTFSKFALNIEGIVVITHFGKRYLINSFNVPESKITVEPDGVKLEEYEKIRVSKEVARKKLGLPLPPTKIVCYTGHLYKGKGVEWLILAAKYLNSDTLVYIVGGYEEDIARLKSEVNEIPHNAVFTGFQEPALIPYFQLAADVMVLPNTYENTNSFYTSPLKLFEYMAAQRPIVASRLEVFEEILEHKTHALLVEPGNPKSLSLGIKHILENPCIADEISKNAYSKVHEFTWNRRAERILKFISCKN